ncbi:MAG: DUF309 domain-containing protein [Dehalococcoidia bacterium]|nr:DUF309 domain-containing protein [Dehalococcoidia bacterium]
MDWPDPDGTLCGYTWSGDEQVQVPMNRQAQDMEWLGRLQRDGVQTLLPQPVDPPQLFFKAIGQFNDGAHWHCHETLEEVWHHTLYPQRLFYYALIKAAVGFVHAGRHNERGAISQFQAAKAYLEPFLPRYLGVRTEPLHHEIAAWLERLHSPAPLPWDAFDQVPRPKIQLALS